MRKEEREKKRLVICWIMKMNVDVVDGGELTMRGRSERK